MALAPTAVEAETLAKTALLSGPQTGRRLLERHGGALILDGGALILDADSTPGTSIPPPYTPQPRWLHDHIRDYAPAPVAASRVQSSRFSA